MSQKWINFRLLKRQLSFEAVLEHYAIKTVKDGPDHVKCRCPFHDDKRASLGVDLKRKIWQCFGCKASGNILDFVTKMEGLAPSDPAGVRKGAEIAAQIMGVDLDGHRDTQSDHVRAKSAQTPSVSEPSKSKPTSAPEPVLDDFGKPNAPLSFELKLERPHKWLSKRGYKRATLETFGIGFAKRGMMKGRVCFPLRNEDGELVGYAGRWASEDDAPDGHEWLFPTAFNQARFIYGLDRLATETDHVVIAPDHWSLLGLHEHGITALTIWRFDIQPPQIELLKSRKIERVSLLQQTDPKTPETLESAILALANSFHVRALTFDEIVIASPSIETIAQNGKCKKVA